MYISSEEKMSESVISDIKGFLHGLTKRNPEDRPKGGILVKIMHENDTSESYVIGVTPDYPKSLESESGKRRADVLFFKTEEGKKTLEEVKEKGKDYSLEFLNNIYRGVLQDILDSAKKEMKEANLPLPISRKDEKGDLVEPVMCFASPASDSLYEALKKSWETLGKPLVQCDGWFYFCVYEGKQNSYIYSFQPNVCVLTDYREYFSPLEANTLTGEEMKTSLEEMVKQNKSFSSTDKILINTLRPGCHQVIVDADEGSAEEGESEFIKSFFTDPGKLMSVFEFINKDILGKSSETEETIQKFSVKFLWKVCKHLYPEYAFLIDSCNVVIPENMGFMFTYVPLGNKVLN